MPAGAGALAPLLAPAVWLHVGKGTVMGMGRLQVVAEGAEPSPSESSR